MTTPKTAHVSFHQWLSLQGHGEFRVLALVWEPCRGRMTAASVERRAHDVYGLPDGLGAKAFRAYQHAIANPS